MTEKLDEILQESEGAVKEANDKLGKGNYFSAFLAGIKALYLQNKARIVLLEDYNK